MHFQQHTDFCYRFMSSSCESHSHTHTLTYRYKSTKAIALRQIPGEHFYGLLRASTHTHTFSHTADLQESVLCVQVQ